jgi:hypothetical protein
MLLVRGIGAADSSAFAYDMSLPLDIREHEVAVRNGIRVALVSYAVVPGVRADGLLINPPAMTPAAAIVWVHSGGMFEQLPDAMLMAQVGAVSLLINPILPDWSPPAEGWRTAMVRSVVSVRRGIDLLITRRGINARRLGFVGHSYGALMGVDAVAVDRRFRAAVFEVGLAGMTVHIRTAPVPFAAEVRKRFGAGLDEAMAVIEPLDAIHYVGSLAPTHLLFQSAHLDPGISDEQAQQFFDAASGPKELKWYDTSHEVLDIAAISDRARFLAAELKLGPIEPILKRKIGLR